MRDWLRVLAPALARCCHHLVDHAPTDSCDALMREIHMGDGLGVLAPALACCFHHLVNHAPPLLYLALHHPSYCVILWYFSMHFAGTVVILSNLMVPIACWR